MNDIAAPLYRGLTAAELEAEYDLRAQVPTYHDHFDAWELASIGTRARLPHLRNVPYGPEERQRLDLFPPVDPGPEPAPLVAFFHGGYWRTLSKDYFSHLAHPFVEAGIAFAAVGYGLCPRVTFDEVVEDARTAVLRLHANAATYGIDPGRLFVAGHSAGAHLAATLLSTDWTARGAPPEPLAGGGAISGAYDLEPVRLTSVNGDIRLDPEQAARYSPVRRIPERLPPVILALGELECAEFHRQQDDYAEALRDAGHDVVAFELPGRHHFDVIDALGEADSPLHCAVRGLVEEGRPRSAVEGSPS